MKKKKIFLEIFSLLCVAALFFVIYVFVELRSSKLCVIGSGVVLLITAYLLIDFLIDSKSEKSEGSIVPNSLNDALIARLDELESIEKAIYTATKRNGSDAGTILGSLSTALENIENQLSAIASSLAPDADLSVNIRRLLSAEQSVHEIIQYIRQDQQNGVKMGIKYNKENARQLAEINNTNTDKLVEKLEALEAALRSGITVSGTVERTVPVVEAPVPEPVVEAPVVEAPAPEPVVEAPAVEAPAPEPVVEAPAVEAPAPEPAVEAPVAEAPAPEPVVEAPAVEIPDVEVAVEAPDLDLSGLNLPDIDIPETMPDADDLMSDDDLQKLLDSLPDSPEEPAAEAPAPEPVVEAPAPEPVVEAPAPEPAVEAPAAEPAVEAPAAGPSLDELMSGDPNKALSPDEIAAMFAAATAPVPAPAPIPEPEPEPEPVAEAPAAGPSLDELMSGDPNKALSPDEIAAMFAAATAPVPAPAPIPEPEPEPEPVAGPSLEELMSGDPNKALTPDEIAAMFAAAGK